MTQQKKGFSLIEVVIALAIFVIGALAIIRIFPTGLGLVEKSGNQQRATNFNRSLMAKRLSTKSVPDAIFDGHFDGNRFGNWDSSFIGAVYGSAKFNNSLPIGVKPSELGGSALDRFFAIKGEQTVVLSGGGGNYALTQSSIDFTRAINIYKEFKVENVSVDSNGNLNWTNAVRATDGSNYNPFATGSPIVLANVAFYATYRYKEGGKIWGAEEEAIPPTATTLFRNTTAVPSTSIIPGTIDIKVRQFFPNTVDYSTAENQAKARCGLIPISNTELLKGDSISIDYVTNWYWILEETSSLNNADSIFGNLPSLRQVELSLPFVRARSTQRFATLLMGNGGAGDHFASTYTPSGFSPPATKVVFPPNSSDLRTTLREGKIAFDIDGVPSPLVRVAYRTQDDWVQQLSVSAKNYKRYITTTAPERWRDYNLDGNVLEFQPSEAGKSVRVTYNYGPNDEVKTELLTIGSEIFESSNLGSTHVVRLRVLPPTGNVTAILSVKGASITARTAWMTNDKYSHNLLTSMRSDS